MDKKKLTELYATHVDALFNYLVKLTRSEDVASDLVQEIFIRVYRYYDNNSLIRNEKSWLFKIAHNVFLNYYKKNQKHRNLVSLSYSPEPADKKSFTEDIDWQIMKTQMIHELKAAKLLYAEIFILRLDHGLTYQEISKVFNLSERTIRRHSENIKKIIGNRYRDDFRLKD